MSKEPTIKAGEFEATVDALISMNALLFTVLASRSQHETALRLLQAALQANEANGREPSERHVLEQTASYIQGLRAIRATSDPAVDE